MTELKPANTCADYLALTLFGEVGDDHYDEAVADLNRAMWLMRNAGNTISAEHKKLIETLTTGQIGRVPNMYRELFPDAFQLRASGAGFADDVSAVGVNSTNLDGLVFERPLNLSGFHFSHFSCIGSEFHQRADFSNAQFNSPMAFRRTEFQEQVNFTKSNFVLDSIFESCKFGGAAVFQSATFTGKAEFNYAEFKKNIFESANFAKTVSFDNAKIEGKAIFLATQFGGEANFRETQFGTETVFSRADFAGFTDFYKATMGAGGGQSKTLTFANAVFHQPTSFEGATFPDRLPVFSGTTLHRTTTMTADSSHWPPLEYSWFQKLDAFLGLGKKQAHTNHQEHVEAKASAAKLREVMALQSLPEDEHFFFRREMHHAGRVGGIWQRIPILLYGAISDYGHSIYRPSTLLFCLWMLGTAFYTFAAKFALGVSASYSFAAMFKFFGFQRTFLQDKVDELEGWLAVASAGQTVLSFVLLFFLGLGLRTRFRLR